MNFSDPEKVDMVIRRMQDSSYPGNANMSKINALFNGDPPWSSREAKRNKVQINIPSQKCPEIMDNARGQWDSAFTSRDKYFRCRCTEGPVEQRINWSMKFSNNLASIMKRSKPFLSTVTNVGASVMLHGRGPLNWENDDKWCPGMISLGDLMIPSRTLTDFENLGYVALYRRYTPFNLWDASMGETPDPNWNKALIKRIIAKVKDWNTQQVDFQNWEFPAEIVEDIKSNSGYWSSDAVPVINCWDFYYRGDKDTGIYRKMIMDRETSIIGDLEGSNEWLYNGKDEVYAENWDQVLQVIYANGCHVAPFRYHSVRGLGYRLFEDGRYDARARGRFKECVLQEMMWIFSNVPAEERERVESFWLSHMGVLPPGVKWVPADERYRPDLNLILAGMNDTRQSMSEQSTSYVMDTAGGGENDRETATKTMARLQTANAMVGNFLNKAYEQWKYVGIEIVRRCLKPHSTDPDVKEFQKLCRDDGIPDELMDSKHWDTEPERVAGNGNRIMAASMADRLMLQYNRLDPQGQKIVLRLYVDANTDDPELGDAIVPMENQEPSSTVVRAYTDIGSLMQGLPAPMVRTENPAEYAATLIHALEALVQRAQQAGNMVDQNTLVGLITISAEIKKRLEILAQDPGAKQQVKQMADILGNLDNEIKGFAQRLQEQMTSQGQQLNPEVQAKIQGVVLLAQTQAQIKEAQARQKMQQNEQKFIAGERRKDIQVGIDARRTIHDTMVENAATDLRTAADIQNSKRKALADTGPEGEA